MKIEVVDARMSDLGWRRRLKCSGSWRGSSIGRDSYPGNHVLLGRAAYVHRKLVAEAGAE